MGLFDRFRAQPAWKHRDPAARLAAVEELSLDDQATLRAIAREDPDARVRQAAVRKLVDAADVAAVRDADQEASVREEANGVLVDTALGAFEGTREADSLAALGHLADAKDLGRVAKEAASERVASGALARITDDKLVGSVARRSTHASVRMAALARVEDPAELAAIALRSDFKDVSVAAVDRLGDADILGEVASRAKNRSAARQAKTVLRARAAAAAAETAGAATVAATAGVSAASAPSVPREVTLCEQVEALAAAGDGAAARAHFPSLENGWNALAHGDDTLQARFAAASRQVRALIEAHEIAEREHAAAVEAAAEETARRSAFCAEVEALATAGGDDLLARLDAAVQEWQAMPPLADDFPGRAAILERFERAVTASRRAHEQIVALAARRRRLEAVVADAETASRTESLAEARARFGALRQEWAAALAGASADEDLAARLAGADAHLRAREQEVREERARRERENLARVRQVADQIETLARAEDLTLRDAERAARELRATLEALGPMPSRHDREELTDRLKAIQAALFPRVQELKDADEWQRWANAGIQEDLCRKAEHLVEVEDAAEAARQLRDLQAQWKKVSAAPRDQSQALWLRFKAAQDAVRDRVDRHYAAQAEERAANLQRKEALCQKAEGLAESSDWIKTAEAIKQLQAAWKEIGAVPRGQEKAIWERFRSACDKFFTRRRDDLSRRKEEWSANLAKKQALIARVDALGTPEDWEKAADEVRRLQGEWRAIGPVRKKQADDLWQRFQQATTKFFERYAERDELQMASNTAEREAICASLEALVPAAPVPAGEPGGEPERAGAEPVETASPALGGPAADALVGTLRAAWTRWEQAGAVPAEVQAAVTERFHRAFAAVVAAHSDGLRGSEFDPAANLRKMEELAERIERLVPAEPAGKVDQSPAAILATRWREALASNTIGGAVALATEEARRRAAVDAVREAQATWKRVGPVPEDLARPIAVRFQKACNKVLEHTRDRRGPAPRPGAGGRR